MSLLLVEQRVMIPAPIERVFDLLSTSEGLCEWMAIQADVDRRPDGVVTWTHENGDRMVGRFVEIEPPTRLVFSYGWANGQLGLAPGGSIVTITLTASGDETELHLVHRDLPAQGAERHEEGWRYFLSKLGAVA